ncbi:MAG TPA: hypothetical protein PK784_05615 [Tenuifilaceae bacterium]|nr:hypothetical protein [Tenuifilaceae bacterium]HPN21727.1 hypothetical protein [Tenuifilaceae bacterium]
MKDKYTGDIGDFTKILLLKKIALINGVRLGINWYFNAKEYAYEKKQCDGKHTNFLLSQSQLKNTDERLFYSLLDIIKKEQRDVEKLHGLIPNGNVLFYKKQVPYRKTRESWVRESIIDLNNSNLIFLDPDNGIAYSDRTGNVKHVFHADIITYYDEKKSLIIYNHKDRYNEEKYKSKINAIIEKLSPQPNIYVLRTRLYSVRDYIFIIRPESVPITHKTIDDICLKYPNVFEAYDL